MSEAFEKVKDKIRWADKRYAELCGEIDKFWKRDPYLEISEEHPDKPGCKVRKIKFTKEMPSNIPHIISEIVGKLRSALDGAAYAAALASGKSAPKNCAFPFGRSLDDLLARSMGRCKDVPIPIQSLFCGFQPYHGGDNLLWSLNEICNAEKHTIAFPLVPRAFHEGVFSDGSVSIEMENPHGTDSAKNEIVLAIIDPASKWDHNLNFGICIGFGNIGEIGSLGVERVLPLLGTKVQSIVETIEAETERLGRIGALK